MNLEVHQIRPDYDPKDFNSAVGLVESKLGKSIDYKKYANDHKDREVILCAKDIDAGVLGMLAVEFVFDIRELPVTAGAISPDLSEEERLEVMNVLVNKAIMTGDLVGRDVVIVDTNNVAKIDDLLIKNGFEAQGSNILVSSVK